ncbi:hypothetical protein BpHYR1_044602 [Brachionus plicatilis]|uniref:Uncharacterized protein n=1 Tax=Brachionus plicatilis TaxID=10195 RepID=A0A3M7PS09_BRAPC|nr:hypothetical protein BpHYR1_044602 [Brachionus plicatilis]
MENLEILILPVSQATIIVPKMDMKKIRPNGTEQDVTDESGELFTHSSLGSFRYQLSSSNSSKTRQRSKLQFKIRSKNFTARKFFRHKVRIVIALLRLVDCAFDKFKLCITLKKNFMRIQQNQKMDNITELVQDTFSAPTDSDKVIFNKDYYKAKKEARILKLIKFFYNYWEVLKNLKKRFLFSKKIVLVNKIVADLINKVHCNL